MKGQHRLRRIAFYGITAALAIALVGCVATGKYPNTTFEPKTDLGRAIDFLWDRLLLLGTIVFVLVEAALLYIVWKYRHHAGAPEPRHIHGNTKLEILWTLIPAVVLVFIAVPTVRVIFQTQAKAPANALKVEVIGHQWWWEFRYPDYGLTTANELYLPTRRTISFSLATKDVLHSFWIPQLGAKRDVISNRTNYVWFTTDSTPTSIWNGFCTEYCGASHGNMQFRVFTVTPEQFESWVAGQKAPAAFITAPVTAGAQTAAQVQTALSAVPAEGETARAQQSPGPQNVNPPTQFGPGAPTGAPVSQPGAAPVAALPPGYVFPREKLPKFTVPTTPLPRTVSFPSNLLGDPARGEKTYSASMCIACHTIRGNPASLGQLAPDLTHIGSRYTLAAGTYPNDAAHLARWIKNSPALKPGSLMPPMGKGIRDPRSNAPGNLDDQQIADIVAYLQALK